MSEAETQTQARRLRRAYLKGYRLELNVRDALIRAGFVVVRGAGSKPIDLVALLPYRESVDAILIECKATGDVDPEAACRSLFNAYHIPCVVLVQRRRTMWDWCLVSSPGQLTEDTVERLIAALGPIYKTFTVFW